MSCQLTVSLCLDNCEPQTVIVNHRITGGFADDPEVNNLKITAAHGSKGTLKVSVASVAVNYNLDKYY